MEPKDVKSLLDVNPDSLLRIRWKEAITDAIKNIELGYPDRARVILISALAREM